MAITPWLRWRSTAEPKSVAASREPAPFGLSGNRNRDLADHRADFGARFP